MSRERILGSREAKVASRHSTLLVPPDLLHAFKVSLTLHMQKENVHREGRYSSLDLGNGLNCA